MSRANPFLRARGLGWESPDGRAIVCNLDLHLTAGSHGLVGPNGIGKTTLLELLAGARAPTTGSVQASGLIGYLPQERTSDDGARVSEALGAHDTLAALARIERGEGVPADFAQVGEDWTLPDRCDAVLDQLNLPVALNRTMGTLSGGQQSRVYLGRLLLADPDFLLLDEPTNHLDAAGRHALMQALSRFTGGLLVSSHDRWLLRRLDRMVSMERQGLRVFDCGYEAWREAREQEMQAALDAYQAADQEAQRTKLSAEATRIKHEQSSARGRKGRGTGSQPAMVLNRRKEQAEASGARLTRDHAARVEAAGEARAEAWAAVEEEAAMQLDLSGTRLSDRKLVARLRGVGFSFGDQVVLHGLDLDLLGPTRLALVGANGSGKTTLARLIVGDLEPSEGTVARGTVRTAWLDQTTRTLCAEDSVLDNLRAAAPDLQPSRARWSLARFRFRGDDVHKPISVLSGGERMRAALACALCAPEPPQLLVLDEPTNNLDLDSRLDLEAALSAYEGALIVISHDTDLLDSLSPDRVLRLPLSS